MAEKTTPEFSFWRCVTHPFLSSLVPSIPEGDYPPSGFQFYMPIQDQFYFTIDNIRDFPKIGQADRSLKFKYKGGD
jgi:hypothetical protein